MFAKLRGVVDAVEVNHAIVDVNGVGYLVHCSGKTLSHLKPEENISLHIETCVREDQITLYGFMTEREKACFLELVTVKGIGPKIALQVLNKLTPDQFCVAVNMKDRKIFSSIGGIGPKIVDRIFAELKDRAFVNDFEKYFPGTTSGDVTNESRSLRDDAISVLTNLGIKGSDAFTLVSGIIAEHPEHNLNEIIKASLNKMAMR